MASSYPTGLDSFATSRADATTMATTHAADHNNLADAVNKIEAELGTAPSGLESTVSDRFRQGRVIHAEDYGFTPYANAVNVDTPLANLITALDSATPESRTVQFPPGNFVLTSAASSAGLGEITGIRLVGSGGSQTQTTGVGDRYFRTTFTWDGAGDGPMLTINAGAGLLKAGPVIEYIDFFNDGPSTADGIYINNVNDGCFRNCGWKLFDRAIHTDFDGSNDCAHWSIYDPMVYNCVHFLYAENMNGMNVYGGEISGPGAGGWGFYLLSGGQELNVFGTKAVGCQNGYAYVASKYNSFHGAIGEHCGDATHPAVLFTGASATYNQMIACRFVGDGTPLPIQLDASATFNYLWGTIHSNYDNHSGLQPGQILNQGGASNQIVDDWTFQGGGYSGGFVGFYGTTPITRQTLSATPTAAQIATVLHNLGLAVP